MSSDIERPKRKPDFKYNGLICEYSVWVEEGVVAASSNKRSCEPFDAHDVYLTSLRVLGSVAAEYKSRYEEYINKVAEQELLGE